MADQETEGIHPSITILLGLFYSQERYSHICCISFLWQLCQFHMTQNEEEKVKASKPGWLKTTELYDPTILEALSPK